MNPNDQTHQFINLYKDKKNDPYGFVLRAYPWRKPGTFLADEDGPDQWQIDVMEDLRLELERRDMSPDELFASIRLAVASGHGVGKTALVVWLIDWFICTRPSPQIIVTAGTAAQLEKKTWRELAKWHRVSLHKDFFEWTATKYYLKERPDSWFAAAIPWSEHRADAFAGTHEKYVLVIFDEASAIADIIWETVEGAMTTYQCIWIAFGNPIRNTGRFRACFTKFRDYWITRKVDSRTARKANAVQIEQWRKQYGEDSDFFRKRVRGEFPHQSSNQLVPERAVMMCRELVAYGYETFPIRIGCDVAGEGESGDDTVIVAMQGNKLLELIRMHGKDTVQIYTKLVECFDYWKKRNDRIMIFVDAIGLGAGVHSLLRRAHIPVIGVISGAAANDPERFINVRIEMWYTMAQAVKEGIDMTAVQPDHFERLKDDLINIEYFEHPQNQRFQLESVDDLKERDLPSPDYGTALALTFAYPVPHTVQSASKKFQKAEGSGTTISRKRGRNGIHKQGGRRSARSTYWRNDGKETCPRRRAGTVHHHNAGGCKENPGARGRRTPPPYRRRESGRAAGAAYAAGWRFRSGYHRAQGAIGAVA